MQGPEAQPPDFLPRPTLLRTTSVHASCRQIFLAGGREGTALETSCRTIEAVVKEILYGLGKRDPRLASCSPSGMSATHHSRSSVSYRCSELPPMTVSLGYLLTVPRLCVHAHEGSYSTGCITRSTAVA